MPFLITWGAWIGAAWIGVSAVLMFWMIGGKAKYDPKREASVPFSLFSRRGAFRLIASVVPGLVLLGVVGAAGYDKASSSPHAAIGGPSVPIEESTLVQLAACSPFHRSKVLWSLRLNFMYYTLATEQMAQRSVALEKLMDGCDGARKAAGSRRIPMPDFVACDEEEPNWLSACEPDRPNFAAALMAGDEAAAIVGARTRAAAADGEQQRKWECIALALEARAGGSLERLRAESSDSCRLVLATLVPPNEALEVLTIGRPGGTALAYHQGPLVLTLLATGSPERAAQEFTEDQIAAWLGHFGLRRYQPGAETALRSVESVDEPSGTLRMLQVLLQAGVGLNAFATVHLEDAAIALERASELLPEAREALEAERLAAQAAVDQIAIPAASYDVVSRIRQGSDVNYTFELSEFTTTPETPFEQAFYALLQSLSKLKMSVRMEEYINEWRAVIVLVQTGELPAADAPGPRRNGHDWLNREWLMSRPPRWATHPELIRALQGAAPNPQFIQAVESGDGEQIALTLDFLSEGDERFYAAFAAAAGRNQSVLSTHWRYLFRSVMCDGHITQRRLRDELFLAHILHDDDWIAALRERQNVMNVHMDDMLLNIEAW